MLKPLKCGTVVEREKGRADEKHSWDERKRVIEGKWQQCDQVRITGKERSCRNRHFYMKEAAVHN